MIDAFVRPSDNRYGLQSYVHARDIDRAKRVGWQAEAGRVVINDAAHEPLAPFGGFKQSGIGRDYGAFGLDAFLEPRGVLELTAAALTCRTRRALTALSELPEFAGRIGGRRRRE